MSRFCLTHRTCRAESNGSYKHPPATAEQPRRLIRRLGIRCRHLAGKVRRANASPPGVSIGLHRLGAKLKHDEGHAVSRQNVLSFDSRCQMARICSGRIPHGNADRRLAEMTTIKDLPHNNKGNLFPLFDSLECERCTNTHSSRLTADHRGRKAPGGNGLHGRVPKNVLG